MRVTSWLLASAVAGLLALPAPAADTKKDPPGTSLIMGQLRATFAAWDLNGDGYLDKAELAKAFRGADAKPYDYKPEKKSDKDQPKDGDKKTDDKPKDGDKKDDSSKGGTTKPDYSKYPDYNFLVALDSDNDEKISKDEFESWARDYAVALKQQLDALQRIAAFEQKLAALQNTAGKKEIQAIQQELKKEQAAYKKMTQNAKSFEKHLQQVMKQLATKSGKK